MRPLSSTATRYSPVNTWLCSPLPAVRRVDRWLRDPTPGSRGPTWLPVRPWSHHRPPLDTTLRHFRHLSGDSGSRQGRFRRFRRAEAPTAPRRQSVHPPGTEGPLSTGYPAATVDILPDDRVRNPPEDPWLSLARRPSLSRNRCPKRPRWVGRGRRAGRTGAADGPGHGARDAAPALHLPSAERHGRSRLRRTSYAAECLYEGLEQPIPMGDLDRAWGICQALHEHGHLPRRRGLTFARSGVARATRHLVQGTVSTRGTTRHLVHRTVTTHGATGGRGDDRWARIGGYQPSRAPARRSVSRVLCRRLRDGDGHPSGIAVTHDLERPTRGRSDAAPYTHAQGRRAGPPIWPCTR